MASLSAATERQLSKLQSVQNRAARLVVGPRVPRGQVWNASPCLQQLHWLPTVASSCHQKKQVRVADKEVRVAEKTSSY